MEELDLNSAREIAQIELSKIETQFLGELRFSNEQECILGWLFFYNSKQYLESGDFTERLAGNGPILVNRMDGSVTIVPSSMSIDDFIKSKTMQTSNFEN